MKKIMQTFMEGLVDRVTTLVGSTVVSTFNTFKITKQIEQQSQLEDMASMYEAEGKQTLADNLRRLAAGANMDDPGIEARRFLDAVLNDQQRLRSLEAEYEQDSDSRRKLLSPARRKRPKNVPPMDPPNVSLDD